MHQALAASAFGPEVDVDLPQSSQTACWPYCDATRNFASLAALEFCQPELNDSFTLASKNVMLQA